MKITITVDRQAFIIATGEDRPEKETVEVSKADFTEQQWELFSKSITTETGGALRLETNASYKIHPTITLAQQVQDKLEKAAAKYAELEEKLKKWLSTPSEEYETKGAIPGFGHRQILGEWAYLPSEISQVTHTQIKEDKPFAYYEISDKPALKEKLDARLEEISAENSRRWKAAIDSVIDDRKAAAEKFFAEFEAAQKEKNAAAEIEKKKIYSERLSSGVWKKSTDAYNFRRYGKPWCAKVALDSDKKLSYEFASFTGNDKGGELEVSCVPDDIIAWGQKDNRNPRSSDHHLLLMLDDGRVKEIDATEARNHLLEKAKAAKKKAEKPEQSERVKHALTVLAGLSIVPQKIADTDTGITLELTPDDIALLQTAQQLVARDAEDRRFVI